MTRPAAVGEQQEERLGGEDDDRPGVIPEQVGTTGGNQRRSQGGGGAQADDGVDYEERAEQHIDVVEQRQLEVIGEKPGDPQEQTGNELQLPGRAAPVSDPSAGRISSP